MNSKNRKIIFWISTGIIFLFEGVIPALTGTSKMAMDSMKHLGYPTYFPLLLAIFKVSGAMALIIPQVPSKVKEWAYAGFTFNLIAATWSHVSVDGMKGGSFFPCVVFIFLAISYMNRLDSK